MTASINPTNNRPTVVACAFAPSKNEERPLDFLFAYAHLEKITRNAALLIFNNIENLDQIEQGLQEQFKFFAFKQFKKKPDVIHQFYFFPDTTIWNNFMLGVKRVDSIWNLTHNADSIPPEKLPIYKRVACAIEQITLKYQPFSTERFTISYSHGRYNPSGYFNDHQYAIVSEKKVIDLNIAENTAPDNKLVS